jgi:hypothetical protein
MIWQGTSRLNKANPEAYSQRFSCASRCRCIRSAVRVSVCYWGSLRRCSGKIGPVLPPDRQVLPLRRMLLPPLMLHENASPGL